MAHSPFPNPHCPLASSASTPHSFFNDLAVSTLARDAAGLADAENSRRESLRQQISANDRALRDLATKVSTDVERAERRVRIGLVTEMLEARGVYLERAGNVVLSDVRLGQYAGWNAAATKWKNALSGVVEIRGDLHITNTNLTSDDLTMMLKAMHHVQGDVRITGNTALLELDALEELVFVGGDFYVSSNPQVEFGGKFTRNLLEVNGDVTIVNHPNADAFLGFRSLREIGGSLRMGNMPSVRSSFVAFEDLVTINGSLDMQRMWRQPVDNVDAFQNLL